MAGCTSTKSGPPRLAPSRLSLSFGKIQTFDLTACAVRMSVETTSSDVMAKTGETPTRPDIRYDHGASWTQGRHPGCGSLPHGMPAITLSSTLMLTAIQANLLCSSLIPPRLVYATCARPGSCATISSITLKSLSKTPSVAAVPPPWLWMRQKTSGKATFQAPNYTSPPKKDQTRSATLCRTRVNRHSLRSRPVPFDRWRASSTRRRTPSCYEFKKKSHKPMALNIIRPASATRTCRAMRGPRLAFGPRYGQSGPSS
jgi:hypothetical protein